MKLRGALLGAGNIALRSHAPQWARDERLSRETEIVAVADLSSSNLEAVREFLPDARPYAEAEQLLERESIDFCDICTPPFTHRHLIEIAARRGLHIVCEKPLASTVADADLIARAVREAVVVFRPCHQYHYSPQWQAVRKLLPRLGRVYFAEYQVLRPAANEGNPNWMPGWRTEPALAGGGILVDHGTHILYQLRSVMGVPRAVQATISRLLHQSYEVEDTALVTLDYGDRLAHLSLTWAARRRAIHFRFVGENGEISGDDRRIVVHAERTEEIQFDDGLSKNSSHSEWYAPLLREFSAQVRGSDRGNEALDEALHVTQLIDRAYESAHLGRALPFEPGIAREREPAVADPRPPPIADGERPVAPPSPSPIELESGSDVMPEKRLDASRKRWIRLARGAAVVAVLAVALVILRKLSWAGFWQAIRSSDPRWLAFAAAVNLVVLGLAAVRWFALLRPLSPLSRLRDAFNAMAVGFAVSAVVPVRAGELARMAWLHRCTGLSKVAILGSMGLDQLLNVAGLMLGLAMLPWLGGVPAWLRPGAKLALVLFAIGLVLVLVFRSLKLRAEDSRPHDSAVHPAGILGRIRQGLTATRSPWAIGASLAASFTAWALELIVMRIAMHAVGIELPLSASLVVLAAVNLMLALPLAPGNIGSFEIGATLGLRGYGIANEKALAFAICYHALQIVPITILGFVIAGAEGLTGLPSEW